MASFGNVTKPVVNVSSTKYKIFKMTILSITLAELTSTPNFLNDLISLTVSFPRVTPLFSDFIELNSFSDASPTDAVVSTASSKAIIKFHRTIGKGAYSKRLT